MSKKLIPPDPKRCQAEKREGSFMTLGPRAMVRCKSAPTVIVAERRKGKDGQRGSMSLCDECLRAFERIKGVAGFTVKRLPTAPLQNPGAGESGE